MSSTSTPQMVRTGQASAGKSRSKAVLDAVAEEITLRAPLLDRGHDVSTITITVRLNVGTTSVRSLAYQEDRIFRH